MCRLADTRTHSDGLDVIYVRAPAGAQSSSLEPAACASCLRPVTPSSMWQASAYTAAMLIAERWWERKFSGWYLEYLVPSRPRFLSLARLWT